MPGSVETLHPQMAALLEARIANASEHRQLYRVVYFSITRDAQDLNQTWAHKCTVHLFAEDATDAHRQFLANEPEHYPCAMLLAIAPVQPDVPEDSMLEISSELRGVQ